MKNAPLSSVCVYVCHSSDKKKKFIIYRGFYWPISIIIAAMAFVLGVKKKTEQQRQNICAQSFPHFNQYFPNKLQ